MSSLPIYISPWAGMICVRSICKFWKVKALVHLLHKVTTYTLTDTDHPCPWGYIHTHTNTRSFCKFWKVGALVHLLYKFTTQSTLENVCALADLESEILECRCPSVFYYVKPPESWPVRICAMALWEQYLDVWVSLFSKFCESPFLLYFTKYSH